MIVTVWVLVDKRGELVKWNSLAGGDEGLEIFRTRNLAKGARMKGERVKRAQLMFRSNPVRRKRD